MAALTERKRLALAALIADVSDQTLAAIQEAFRDTPGQAASVVREAALAARLDRAARAMAFGPVEALFRARPDGVRLDRFSRETLNALWSELKQVCPAAVAGLTAHVSPDGADLPIAAIVTLNAEAGRTLREGDPRRWGLPDAPRAERLAAYFELAPLARNALPRLSDWLARMDVQRATELRLVLRDASAERADGAPRLMELLFGQMPQGARVLRLMSAATDHGRESFLRGSEMSDFCDRLIERVERAAEDARKLGPKLSLTETRAVLAAMDTASEIIAEFDLSLPLERDGAWGRRLARARAIMIAIVEEALREIERVIAKALPLTTAKLAGAMSRQAPNLSADPDAPSVLAARILLTILAGTRRMAVTLGWEALRNQVAEATADRLDAWAEDGLNAINAGAVDDDARARALIEIAGEFLGLARDEQAAVLVRRRLAVALSAPATVPTSSASGEAA